jgi:glycosyltransferase involved in cell wall biosynthesis
MKNLKGSFVVPSFNSAAFLAHAVNSAQRQSYANIEIVVVDDGSTDSTRKLMEFMAEKDARIKYIRLETNQGRSLARNIGNKAATGDFIMVLDADDVAYPDRAKLTAEKIAKGAEFVHGSFDYIDAIGSMLGTHIADVFNLDRAIKEKVNRIVHSSCASTRELALRNPYRGQEASKLGLDDWSWQIECAVAGAKFEHIAAVIGAYRDIPSGISKSRDPLAVDAFKTAYLESLAVVAR